MFDDWAYRDTYTRPNDRASETPSNLKPPKSGTGHHSSHNNNASSRRRAKSILQSVAIESKEEPKLNLEITVPKRRTVSLSGDKPHIPFLDTNLFPFSKSEILALEHRFDPLSYLLEKEPLEFDSVDRANDFSYIAFRDTTILHANSCLKLLERSDDVITNLDQLFKGYNIVQDQTTTFETACEEVILSQTKKIELSKQLHDNLAIFNSLEKTTRLLNSPGADIVTRTSFKSLLADLDRGLEYVDKHKTFRDIDLYKMRFRQCLTRALSLIQVYFNKELREINADIIKKGAATNLVNSATQSALLYAKFEKEAPRLRELTDEISMRCENHEEYKGLLNDCVRGYFEVRHRLLAPIISKNSEESSTDTRGIVQYARSSLEFFKSICDEESRLFASFFSNFDENVIVAWLYQLCNPLYDEMRQRIIRESDITSLCELTSILLAFDDTDNAQSFEGGDELGFQINYMDIFRPILQDVQSRLVFRVQGYIDLEIVKYVPKEDDITNGFSHRKSSIKSDEQDANKSDEFDTDNLFIGWYPPLRKAVTLLSQIYQLVNSTVFDDLAHRVVHDCIASLQNASQMVVTRSGAADAQLFLIKHLLLLRTQIAEFDIEYIPAEIKVDFSGLAEAFTLVRSEGVTFTSANLLKLAKVGVPKVINNMVDAKEELYVKLRNTINEFTETRVQSVVSPITSNPSAETVVQDTRKLRENISKELPRIRKNIENYIDDDRTADILMDSIHDLIVQSYERYYASMIKQAANTHQIEGIMEVDALVAWLADAMGKMYSDRISTSHPQD